MKGRKRLGSQHNKVQHYPRQKHYTWKTPFRTTVQNKGTPTKFSEKQKSNITKTFQMEDKERNTSEIDEELSSQAKQYTDIGQFTIKVEEVIQTTCTEICKPPNTQVKGKKNTLVDGITKDKEEKNKRIENRIPTDDK